MKLAFKVLKSIENGFVSIRKDAIYSDENSALSTRYNYHGYQFA